MRVNRWWEFKFWVNYTFSPAEIRKSDFYENRLPVFYILMSVFQFEYLRRSCLISFVWLVRIFDLSRRIKQLRGRASSVTLTSVARVSLYTCVFLVMVGFTVRSPVKVPPLTLWEVFRTNLLFNELHLFTRSSQPVRSKLRSWCALHLKKHLKPESRCAFWYPTHREQRVMASAAGKGILRACTFHYWTVLGKEG